MKNFLEKTSGVCSAFVFQWVSDTSTPGKLKNNKRRSKQIKNLRYKYKIIPYSKIAQSII